MLAKTLVDTGFCVPAGVWRADALALSAGAVQASGHPALDAELPGGGWPLGAMVEVLQAQTGQNEWRLLLPALRQLGGVVVLAGPPHLPFGPGLAAQGFNPQRLLCLSTPAPALRMWAAEQSLRCADVAAVLAWLPQVRAQQLRRLQMAASEHGKLLFVMRAAQARAEASPAVLRLLLAPAACGCDDLLAHILKRRGPPLEQPVGLAGRAARLTVLLAAQALTRRQQGACDALDCLATAA